MLPNVEHRYCMRHMYSNFREKFKGKELKDLFWKAASASTLREFNVHMKKLEELDPKNKPHLWMKRENPACWARSHFSTRAKCDILVNNTSESFNSYIMEARDKPIITMLEYIRTKFMNRIQIKKQGMEKYIGPICPSIQKKLEINKVDSGNCFPIFAGELKFEVDCHDSTHIVD